jgi:hypothetical protein
VDASVDSTLTATCQYGKPEQQCFTHDALVAFLNSPGPRGGDTNDGGREGHFDSNGCLPANEIQDGCCNSASAGPAFSGGQCCYVFCTGACCGRPFVVDGVERTAPVVGRSGWALPFTLDREIVDDRIAAAWARDAAMEHASVASFARFTLDLLAHGAPADLVLAAQDAARDEIQHARACFAIASRHLRRELGPGPLDVAGAAASADLAELVTQTVIEGCVGETLSALLAEARHARAEDADARAALATIAEDEARHAELAWKVLGWAIAKDGDRVRHAALAAFGTAMRARPSGFDPVLVGLRPRVLREHGLLDEETARAVVDRAFDDVIGPCALRLVEPATGAAA